MNPFRVARLERPKLEATNAQADILAERCVVQFFRTVERRSCAIDLEADRADGRSMRDVMGVREPFFFLVDDQIDRTLRPSRYCFRFVLCDVAKSEAGDKSREFVGGTVVNREFDEFDT